MRADLHLHSFYSDGAMSPEEVASNAKTNNVQLIALTDHDTMLGCQRAHAACKEQGISYVYGLEISAYNFTKVHVLGYNVDYNSAPFKEYAEWTRLGSEERARDILSKLKKRGIHLTMTDVERERKISGTPIHSMFIARAGSRKGYSSSPNRFYLDYLMAGKCAFSTLRRPTPEQAVRIILESGGIPVLAHPGRIFCDKSVREDVIKGLVDCGLKGIEVFYSGHTMEETAYYKEMAENFNLLKTGGSDTHYNQGNRSIGTPEFYPDEALLSALKIN